MLDGLKRISTALGLLAATAAVTQAQTPAQSFNQATAEAVAGVLRSSPNLSPYRIEIETQGGLATLSGTLATLAQKAEAISLAQRIPGVTGVIDRLNVATDSRVRPVQYQMAGGHPAYAGAPGGGEVIYDGNATNGPGMPAGMMNNGMMNNGMMNNGMNAGMMGPAGSGPANGPGMDGGPMPEGPAGMPGATQSAMPRNPNYAWPSYAPYPNFSAVGYPTAYPWQAWPNIAPPHPYPEVPLDWRAVTLRWDDGIWWLDFKKHYTRPFFTPYPFGIFAY
jgi:BON domain